MSGDRKRSDKPPPLTTKAVAPRRNKARELMGFHATETDPMVGKLISNAKGDRQYRILKNIDRGGMGIVYLAEGLHEKGNVAVKVLHTKFEGDQKKHIAERFLREARALMAVAHENTVQIKDIGTYEGDPFFVMEYLQGHELEKAFRGDKRIDWKIAKPILLQVCDALGAVHEKNVIHRDLKPSNIYLIKKDDGGLTVKVLDFGLAKFRGDASDNLTQTGFFMGTAVYASPEQAAGKKDYDHRVDVYALGVIMYRMLCGEVPFKGESDQATLLMHLGEPPIPPSIRNREANIPPAIERMVLKALKKDPEDRFQNMEEMRTAIENSGIGNVDERLLERSVKQGTSSSGVQVSNLSEIRETDYSFSFEDEEKPVYRTLQRKKSTVGRFFVSAAVAAAIGLGVYHYYEPIEKTVSGWVQAIKENGKKTEKPAEEQKAVPYTVKIETKPSGAKVYVEQELGGRKVRRPVGTTPFTKTMPAGKHKIILKKWGREAAIEVSPDNSIHNVELRKK